MGHICELCGNTWWHEYGTRSSCGCEEEIEEEEEEDQCCGRFCDIPDCPCCPCRNKEELKMKENKIDAQLAYLKLLFEELKEKISIIMEE